MSTAPNDPRRVATFHVRITAGHDDAEYARDLATAVLDVPVASDEEVARLVISTDDDVDAPTKTPIDAYVVIAPQAPLETTLPVFQVHKSSSKEVTPTVVDEDDRTIVVGPKLEHIDLLRAALLNEAFRHLDISVERTRRAKRPYATAIIAGASLMAGAEGVLPGAAAFVIATQVTAIASLHYLYTGKWMGRAHVMTLLPVFASEAAGGSLFLLIKSVLPPTGVGEVAAAIVASSMTLAMLGSVALLLEQGHQLDEKEKLRHAFERMNAKTKAERARLVRDRHRWKDKTFFRDLVRRLVFE